MTPPCTLAVIIALTGLLAIATGARADTSVPADAYLGSTDWLSTPATIIAGQEEVVYCNLPPDSYADAMTGLFEETPGGPWVGHLIWMKADLCQLLWRPVGKQAWWLAGHAVEALGHEIAHDSLNDCGDKAADRDGLAMSGRLLNTILGYRGIRVKPKQRRWALAGARAEAGGPIGADPINPGCSDYTD